MNKVSTSTLDIELIEDGQFLMLTIKPNAVIEVADVIDNHDACLKITKGEKYPILVDGRTPVIITKEAREYAASKEATRIKTLEAILVTSLANKLIGNFYINYNKPMVPSKLFTNKEKALKWLNVMNNKKFQVTSSAEESAI